MSYTAYLYIDTGGPEPALVCVIGNMTSNVSPMWTKALGFPLRDMQGWLASECIPHLERAVEAIADPITRHEYTAMNPSNGWGSVESAEGILREMLRCCREHPKTTFRLSC